MGISDQTWFIYLIETHCGKIYTGITKNLLRRWKQHCLGVKGKGARFLQIYPPKELIYWEIVENHSRAIKREIEIKKFNAKKKLKLAYQS